MNVEDDYWRLEMLMPEILLLLLLLFLSYVCFRLYKVYKETQWQNMKYEKQLEFFHIQARERDEVFKEMQQFRHDFKNHLIGLNEYVEQDNKEKIREYMDILLHELKGGNYEHKSGNLVVDAVTGYKFRIMKQKDIVFVTQFSIPDMLSFEETDLCVILGNILDNAIEASEKITKSCRRIELQMEYRPGSLFIVVKNKYAGRLSTDRRGRLLTTKEEKTSHGIGIRSIERIARKYQGIVTIEPSNDEFEIRILLYENHN